MPPKRTDDDSREVAEPTLARGDRDAPHADDRGGEGRAYSTREWETANAPTDPEERRRFRERYSQKTLPDLPKKDGWHRFWATTANASDTPESRARLGYRFLKLSDLEVEGWAQASDGSIKDGAGVDGFVRCREMIGMEIPEVEYQRAMREFHHDLPRDMARDIYVPLQETQERILDAGGKVEFGDGFREMLRYRRADRQFE